MLGRNWRPDFTPRTSQRELEIIRRDLHCNAVRIQGLDLDRLRVASEDALRLGLEVWFSPEIWDRDAEETLAYDRKAAACAEELRQRWGDRVVFSVGSELSLFSPGFLPGSNVLERLAHPAFRETLKAGTHNPPLNAFLTRAVAGVREVFRGPVTYASVGIETVDWTPFDIVGVDLYREKGMGELYSRLLERYMAFGKPVANMEFGCCTFKGAEDLGGRGWEIVDWSTTPPRLNGTYEYDQPTQARELSELLRINDRAGLDASFVFTFVEPGAVLRSEVESGLLASIPFDLDIVRYSPVKSLFNGTRGTTYPDMTWEPKESFRAVADYYAAHGDGRSASGESSAVLGPNGR
jgi:hypothetical protein